MSTIKTPASFSNVKTWGDMSVDQKVVFVAKVAIMVCTLGFVFGGVLVDGVVYETYVAD